MLTNGCVYVAYTVCCPKKSYRDEVSYNRFRIVFGVGKRRQLLDSLGDVSADASSDTDSPEVRSEVNAAPQVSLTTDEPTINAI